MYISIRQGKTLLRETDIPTAALNGRKKPILKTSSDVSKIDHPESARVIQWVYCNTKATKSPNCVEAE